MHLALTERLTCPRCGPDYPLVLLADRVIDRRVLDGVLGCSNCRERYPVRAGFADLRLYPGPEPPLERGGTAESDEAFRLAAFMGVAAGPGFTLLAGEVARLGSAIAGLIEQLEVVGVHAGLAPWTEEPGFSRLATQERLPLASRSMLAVALSDAAADAFLEEGARVVAAGGRLVLLGAPPDAAARLEAAGFAVAARSGNDLVATARGAQ